MKLLNELKKNQAVYLDNEKYLVQLAYGTYKINNKEFTIEFNQVIVDSIDNIELLTKTYPSDVIGYYSLDDDRTLTLDDYNELNKKASELYTAKKHTPELEYEYLRVCDYFNNLDSIYAEPTIEYKKVLIDVIGTYEDTGSDFIQTAISLGRTDFYNKGIYCVLESQIALDEYNKIQSIHPKLSVPNGYIEYCKFNDTFLFTGVEERFVKSKHTSITKTLEEAKEREAYIRKFVDDKLYSHIYPVKIDVYVKDVINDLENLLRTFNKVESLKSTKFEYNYGMTELRNCIKKLQELE